MQGPRPEALVPYARYDDARFARPQDVRCKLCLARMEDCASVWEERGRWDVWREEENVRWKRGEGERWDGRERSE